jgi:hypothetical protein
MEIDTRKSKGTQHREIVVFRGFWSDSEFSESGSNVSDCSPPEPGTDLYSLLANFPYMMLVYDNRKSASCADSKTEKCNAD